MSVHLKYINTDGDVRTLKLDRVQTIASGEKAVITVPADVATFQEKSETKYLVAIRGVRDGFPDTWWGVKVQDGKVEDKNEFVGLRFQSFTTKTPSGRATKNLTMTLRPRE